jgi:CheY-like chemotaxis protein
MQVLVAEDNPVNHKVVTKLLERLGCSVEVAENGREAVAGWAQGTFDMVFMDVQMPEMDGLEATRIIRQAESEAPGTGRPRTPIIAVTAHALPADRARCLAAGMDAHIAKPVTLELLATAIAKHGTAGEPIEPPATLAGLEPTRIAVAAVTRSP